MENKKHTPGTGKPRCGPREGWHVKTHMKPGVYDGRGEVVALNLRCESDARLIAAAPDLLEGIKAMQRAFDNYSSEFCPSGKPKKVVDWGQLNEDMCKASAAIAKAEGDA
jgi:hypothetical protein